MLGVRVGEASNPGPPSLRHLRRNRSALFEISSDEEPLIRGIGRNVVARVEGVPNDTHIEVCSETVPASQSALIAVGISVVTEQVQSHILDALEEDLGHVGERVPDTVFDSLAEDSDRPHRRLTLVCAGHDQAHQVLDATQWESGAQFSFPSRPSEFQSYSEGQSPEVVDMTIGDSDGEQRDQTHRDPAGRRADANTAPRFEPWVGGTPSTFVDVVEESNSVRPENIPDDDMNDDNTESIEVSVRGVGVHGLEVDSEEDTEACSMVSGEAETEEVSDDPLEIPVFAVGAMRAAFLQLDEVDLVHHFSRRAAVMKAVPKFLTAPFRNALRIALVEATVGSRVQDLARQERGWKLFLLLPRLLLHRPPRGGTISRGKLQERFAKFARGEWIHLLQASKECDEQAAEGRCRQRHRRQDDVERRANRAFQLVRRALVSQSCSRGGRNCTWESRHSSASPGPQPTTSSTTRSHSRGSGQFPTHC